MKYLLLIHSDERAEAKMPPQEMESLMADYAKFTERLKATGVYVGGQRLRPTSSATTVRIRSGETLTSDGPFAETKEQLGGFFMIEAKDMAEAVSWGAKVPSAKHGSIEVRPVWQ
jgi:hypothetical protein